jgi:hypothetical protein
MKTISLTIPMDCNALTRSAEMLTGLAADILEASILSTAPTLPEGQVNKPAETPEGQFVEGLSFADRLAHFNEIAAEKIAALGTAAKAETPEGEKLTHAQYVANKLAIPGSRPDGPAPELKDFGLSGVDFQEPPHEKTPAEVFSVPGDIIERWSEAPDATRVHDEVILNEAETWSVDESETARVLAEMEGGGESTTKKMLEEFAKGPGFLESSVELDGDHLPWDHRIHASSKAKLSKAPNCWKRKRGVAPDVIAEVEAELRAAMSAGPDKPIAPAPAKPAVPAEPATPAPAAATDRTVATFPELMAAITAGGIAPPAVQAALNLQGITSLPLLASRPDLIPAVAETLGL